MNKVISFHSSRGGTGKTILAVNLASLLAHRGLNVALIDLDFRAPSLYHIFEEVLEDPVNWVNDYLDSRCDAEDSIIDLSRKLNLKGNFLVGFANPSVSAVSDMLGKSRNWKGKVLRKLLDLRKILFKDLGVNFSFFDTSPGIQYSSLNALICSDVILFVVTSDPLDLEGVRETIKEFSDVFENRTLILLNKAFPETRYWPNDKQKRIINQLSKEFSSPVIEVIPCYCSILEAKRSQLLAFEMPNHPFVKKLEEVAEKFVGGKGGWMKNTKKFVLKQ